MPLPNDGMTDVTTECDVSEMITSYESDKTEDDASSMMSSMPTFQEVPPDTIVFSSMDGKHYMIDKNSINWEETAKCADIMERNIFEIRQTLMSMMCNKDLAVAFTSSEPPQEIQYVHDVVRKFVEDFGFEPEYEVVYPYGTDYDIAQCYCIDAIELINLIMCEIKIYKSQNNS